MAKQDSDNTTHFGYQSVPADDKALRIEVFCGGVAYAVGDVWIELIRDLAPDVIGFKTINYLRHLVLLHIIRQFELIISPLVALGAHLWGREPLYSNGITR